MFLFYLKTLWYTQDHILFKFTNFVTPGTIYYGVVQKTTIDPDLGAEAEVKLKVYRETKVPGIDADDFETKQVGARTGNGEGRGH